MKKRRLWNRLAAGTLAGLLVFSSLPENARAEGQVRQERSAVRRKR